MSPDDSRHGKNAGYIAGCRNQCCKTAHAAYKKSHRNRVYLNRGPLQMAAHGAHRRVQALMRLGWTMEEISEELGHSQSWCHQLMRHDTVYVDTHNAIAALFDRWCMTIPPPRRIRSRIRNLARARNYAPGLAWDDIDDPNERPKLGHKVAPSGDIDEAVVLRLLRGEYVPSSRAEKDEAMRRWVAQGRSAKSLEDTHGWKSGRYGSPREDAA